MSDPTREALLRELDACQPRYEGGSPNPTNGGATTFSGWYVPDWLMKRIRDALSTTPAPLDEIIKFIDSTLALTPRTGTDDYTGGVTEGMHIALGIVREKAAAISTTPARDYGLASIVAEYLRLDDALPDEKPDTMPGLVWDARVREVTNARAGVDAFLAEYEGAPHE